MFKVIEEFPKYEINCEGLIRNIKTKTKKYVPVNKQGYYQVQFKKDGKTFARKVHRLVAMYFLEEPSEELKKLCSENYPYVVCVNHIDHDKTNNHYSNLEWCTHEHNTKESWRVGNTPALKGTLNGRSVLTEDLVHKVCKDFEKGMMPKEAVEKYEISRQQATKIRAGHAWKHIWEQYSITVNKRKK
tara:strand:+ start:42571 stop:43131 length:561 start_codon:yes stop_codon:yes gene_type:complete